MKAREGEIIEDGSTSVLSSDDVIDMEGPRVDGGRQMAILATVRRRVAGLPRLIPGSQVANRRCFLSESDACLRLHDGKEIPHVEIAVELCLFFGGQASSFGSLGQVQHSTSVILVEVHRQKELRSLTGQLGSLGTH